MGFKSKIGPLAPPCDLQFMLIRFMSTESSFKRASVDRSAEALYCFPTLMRAVGTTEHAIKK